MLTHVKHLFENSLQIPRHPNISIRFDARGIQSVKIVCLVIRDRELSEYVKIRLLGHRTEFK